MSIIRSDRKLYRSIIALNQKLHKKGSTVTTKLNVFLTITQELQGIKKQEYLNLKPE